MNCEEHRYQNHTASLRARVAEIFRSCALFNFAMGGPIFFAPEWSYRLAYIGDATAATLRFWGDFGFAVLLIGLGYWMVSRDINANRGIVWLGVFAKLFDVVALIRRWQLKEAHAIVLLPAAIDGAFLLLFIFFLRITHDNVRIQTAS